MRKLSPELEAKIDEIHSWMFDGDQELVAAKANKSRVWVNRVLNKHAFNPDIIEAGIEVMNQNKARFEITPLMKAS